MNELCIVQPRETRWKPFVNAFHFKNLHVEVQNHLWHGFDIVHRSQQLLP
jgi:hypothetical protein